MNDKDRIRLAEAMGYVTTRQTKEWHGDRWEGRTPDGEATWRLPDPFTDANDDYAVLEWMRDDSRRMEFPRYVGALSDVMDKRLAASHAANYQIGNYARAALKVLDYE